MRKLLWGVLAVLAAIVVLCLLVLGACGIMQGKLALTALPHCERLVRAVNIGFVAYLFVMATGTPADWALKHLRVRSLLVYLAAGAVSAVVAEHCFLVDNAIQDTWNFCVPPFAAILSDALAGFASSLDWMEQTLPESAIPIGVGLVGSALYWLIAVRRRGRSVEPPVASKQAPVQTPQS